MQTNARKLMKQIDRLQQSIDCYQDAIRVISEVYQQGTRQEDKFRTNYTDPYVVSFFKEFEGLSLERQGYLNKREKVLNQLEKFLPMDKNNVD